MVVPGDIGMSMVSEIKSFGAQFISVNGRFSFFFGYKMMHDLPVMAQQVVDLFNSEGFVIFEPVVKGIPALIIAEFLIGSSADPGATFQAGTYIHSVKALKVYEKWKSNLQKDFLKK